MDKNRDKSSRFDNYEIKNTNPDLAWKEIGEGINKGVAERQKKEKRRRFFIWFLGFGLLIGISVVGSLLLPDTAARIDKSDSVNNHVAVSSDGEKRATEDILANEAAEDSDQAVTKHGLRQSEQTKLNVQQNISDGEVQKVRERYDGQRTLDDSKPLGTTLVYTAPRALVNSDIEVDLARKPTIVSEPKTSSSQYQSTTDYETKSESALSVEGATSSEVLASLGPLPRLEAIVIRQAETATGLVGRVVVPVTNDVSQSTYSFGLQSFVHFTDFGAHVGNAVDELGLGLELLVSRPLHKNIHISSGLAYDRYHFRTEFEEVSNVLTYSPMTVDTVYSFDGEVVHTTTTDSIPGLSTRTFRHHNTISYIAIPIQLTYQVGHGPFQIMPTVGVAIPLAYRAEGRVADALFTISDIDQAQGSQWRYFGQIGATCRLSDQFSVGLTTRYSKVNFQGTTVSSSSVGLQLLYRI